MGIDMLGKFVLPVVTALSLAAQAQIPKPYASGETRGQVVDADSGAPIQGANVVARWEWEQSRYVNGGGGYSNYGYTVHVGEAVSGADGRFTIARWGPTMKSSGRMAEDTPRLLAFKSGYEPVGQTVKTGTTLKLRKFAGDPKAFARLIAKFQDGHEGLGWTFDEDSIAIPKMIMALHRERIRLGTDGAAILGANKMPGRGGEGHLVDTATRISPQQVGVIWVEWTMHRTDGAAGTRRVVQTMYSTTMGSSGFSISPWILPGPQVAGWEIDPSVMPMVRAYVAGYQRSADVRWEEKGGTLNVTKLDGSRDAALAELRAGRREIDAQLAQGDRAEALVLQEAMFRNFQWQCGTLTPDLQAGLCFDANSDIARAIYAANHRGVEERRPVQATVAMPRAASATQARPQFTKPVKGFTIEPTLP